MSRRNRKINRGSAVIEMTLLIPVFMGCIYFYIITMLFFIEGGKIIEQLSERLYKTEEDGSYGKEIVIYTQGDTEIAKAEKEQDGYHIVIELRKDNSDPIKNLRRWQFIAETVK